MSATGRKKVKEINLPEKVEGLPFMKRLGRLQKRAKLGDFDRFRAMILKKQVRMIDLARVQGTPLSQVTASIYIMSTHRLRAFFATSRAEISTALLKTMFHVFRLEE